jgi:hypothetical protein
VSCDVVGKAAPITHVALRASVTSTAVFPSEAQKHLFDGLQDG